jgi:pimeloyl-ACP methyl ester carboxylesterase
MRIPPPGRLVDVGGRRLHVSVVGQGRPVVVLEAGIAASSLSWALVAKQAAEFATVVTYDRAGFGWSDPAPHRCTALDSARDLALLLDQAQIAEPCVLVGHSFGGLIVRVFEQEFPGRVAGLVLVDPVSRSEWREPGEQRKRMLARGVMLSRRGELLARMGVVRLALNLLMSGSRTIPKMLARVSAGRGAGVTERLTGEVRKMPRELWPAVAAHWSEARCFRAMANALENLPVSAGQIDEGRSLGESGELPIVVLSAAGASIQAIAEHERDARLSTRGEHRVVPGSGHWMQLDAPDAVVEAIGATAGDAARKPGGSAEALAPPRK